MKFDEEISYERTNKSYMLAIISTVTVRNFGVILDNFNAVRVYEWKFYTEIDHEFV